MYSFLTTNAISKVIDSDINILYQNSNTIFDHIIKRVEGIKIIDANDQLLYNNIYHFYASNNYLDYSNSVDKIKNLQLNGVVFFHNYIDSNFKKEDKFILQSALKNTYKIMMSEDLYNHWKMPELSTQIKYGLPKIEFKNSPHKKSVVVLNSKKNPQMSSLFQNLNRVFSDSALLENLETYSLENLTNIISGFKVCIDIDSQINNLFSLYCGCQAIGSSVLKETNYTRINTFENIDNVIREKIANFDSKIIDEDNSKNLSDKYSFDEFSTNLKNSFSRIKMEPFIL